MWQGTSWTKYIICLYLLFKYDLIKKYNSVFTVLIEMSTAKCILNSSHKQITYPVLPNNTIANKIGSNMHWFDIFNW